MFVDAIFSGEPSGGKSDAPDSNFEVSNANSDIFVFWFSLIFVSPEAPASPVFATFSAHSQHRGFLSAEASGL